jgi:hypothetical protein
VKGDERIRTAVCAPGADPVYGHRGIRLTSDEIDDLCYRHCELGEPLSAEEIDRLLDTAAAAHALAADLDNRLRGAAS